MRFGSRRRGTALIVGLAVLVTLMLLTFAITVQSVSHASEGMKGMQSTKARYAAERLTATAQYTPSP